MPGNHPPLETHGGLRLLYRLAGGAHRFRGLLPRHWTSDAATDADLDLGGDPVFRGREWTRRILPSQFRCELLRRFAADADPDALAAFVAGNVKYESDLDFPALREFQRPLILATPHYGAYVLACMVALHDFGKRRLNIFYEDPDRNPANARFERIFRKRENANILLNGGRGVIGALRALRNGECLTMMPDVYLDVDDTIVVPFFGRLMRAMTGSAFFSLRADALVVPVYVMPDSSFGIRIRISQPLDPRDYQVGDDDHRMFCMTRDLFADMEAVFRVEPEHWAYWKAFRSLSSSRGVAAGDASLRDELKARLRVVPFVARRAPAFAAGVDALGQA